MNNSKEIHRRKIKEIADEYEARGYRVLAEPPAADLPSFLRGFRPDIVAQGPHDSVVVEVKVGTKTASSERYRELAEAIQAHPGWRFSLVVVDPCSDEIAPFTQQLLDRDRIADRLKEARTLGKQGMKDAAFILLSSSIEALVRNMASREGLPLERMPSSGLLKELFSLGLLSRKDLDTALRAFSIRNALVHGFEAPELDTISEELFSLAETLLEELDRAGSKTG